MNKRLISGPVVLVILDGWGLRDEPRYNPIYLARTSFFDQAARTYPFTTLAASGAAVGLPKKQIGNSEIGHLTIGSGRVLQHDLVRINREIQSGTLSQNPALQKLFVHIKKNDSQLHVIGLLSPGGVHSHEDHFFAILKEAQVQKASNIILHPFLDGRDSSRTSGKVSLQKLEKTILQFPNCSIGSVMGRYYAMDRDTNWERTEKAFAAIVEGKATNRHDASMLASQIVIQQYHKKVFDEHIEPVVFVRKGHPFKVKNGDGIIFTNFRSDRTKQLAQKITVAASQKNLCIVTMTDYGKEIKAHTLFKRPAISNTLGEVISQAGLSQAHVAETEKYAHVTYFFNGGKQEPNLREEQVLIPSRKDVKTHDAAPQMRAAEITVEVLRRLNTHDFLLINYANADMVGHSGNEAATIEAIETVDRELGRLIEAVLQHKGALVVTADHGNAETRIDPKTGELHTAHTLSPVPCILVSNSLRMRFRKGGGLDDIAPTVLKLFGLSQPAEMTGAPLF